MDKKEARAQRFEGTGKKGLGGVGVVGDADMDQYLASLGVIPNRFEEVC